MALIEKDEIEKEISRLSDNIKDNEELLDMLVSSYMPTAKDNEIKDATGPTTHSLMKMAHTLPENEAISLFSDFIKWIAKEKLEDDVFKQVYKYTDMDIQRLCLNFISFRKFIESLWKSHKDIKERQQQLQESVKSVSIDPDIVSLALDAGKWKEIKDFFLIPAFNDPESFKKPKTEPSDKEVAEYVKKIRETLNHKDTMLLLKTNEIEHWKTLAKSKEDVIKLKNERDTAVEEVNALKNLYSDAKREKDLLERSINDPNNFTQEKLENKKERTALERERLIKILQDSRIIEEKKYKAEKEQLQNKLNEALKLANTWQTMAIQFQDTINKCSDEIRSYEETIRYMSDERLQLFPPVKGFASAVLSGANPTDSITMSALLSDIRRAFVLQTGFNFEVNNVNEASSGTFAGITNIKRVGFLSIVFDILNSLTRKHITEFMNEEDIGEDSKKALETIVKNVPIDSIKPIVKILSENVTGYILGYRDGFNSHIAATNSHQDWYPLKIEWNNVTKTHDIINTNMAFNPTILGYSALSLSQKSEENVPQSPKKSESSVTTPVSSTKEESVHQEPTYFNTSDALGLGEPAKLSEEELLGVYNALAEETKDLDDLF